MVPRLGISGGMEVAAPNIMPSREISRRSTYHRQLGRMQPVRFSPHSRWRFQADRAAILLRRVGGQPDERQAHLIDQMIHAEWQALMLGHEAKTAASEQLKYRRIDLAQEARRQLLLLDRELAATTRQARAAPPPKTARPLSDIVADLDEGEP